MLRKLLALLLRADLEPKVVWPAAESPDQVAHMSVEVPRPFLGADTEEQVLHKSGSEYVLFKRWVRSGHISRVRFQGPLYGRQMRLAEWLPPPQAIYRLALWPSDGAAVVYEASIPTWLRLWRNQHETGLGAGICFIDSTNREELKDLRFQLLDGKIPESLQNEEEMWQRINGMSEEDRQAAIAALTMQSLAHLDRQFEEMHPDAGPIPDELKPAFTAVQNRIRGIEHTAAAHPVDPQLENLMQRFVADATSNNPAGSSSSEPENEAGS